MRRRPPHIRILRIPTDQELQVGHTAAGLFIDTTAREDGRATEDRDRLLITIEQATLLVRELQSAIRFARACGTPPAKTVQAIRPELHYYRVGRIAHGEPVAWLDAYASISDDGRPVRPWVTSTQARTDAEAIGFIAVIHNRTSSEAEALNAEARRRAACS